MKNLIADFILFTLVSGIGFILPWWSVFIICFFWAFLKLASPLRILATVFMSYSLLIALLGHDLIQVLKIPNFKYAMIPLVALIFSLICFCVSQLATELNKMLKKPELRS